MKTASIRAEEDTFDLSDLWETLRRRRRLIFGITALFVVLMALYCLLSTRRYEATGQIEVQKEVSDSLGLNSALGIAAGGEDSLLMNVDIQTQTNILQSHRLALQVIEDLGLEKTGEFKSRFNPISFLLGSFSPHGRPDSKGASLKDSPNRREKAVANFTRRLKVTPVPGTRLIEVSYLSSDPQLAPVIVNHLIQGLTDFTFQTGSSSTSHWVDNQLSDLRADSERLQEKVVRMQEESGIVSTGGTDAQGHEQAYSSVVDQLQQISTALGQAEVNLILKRAIYDVVKTSDPELISGLSSNLSSASSSGVSTSLNLIQNLRAEETSVQVDLAQSEAKFGAGYPRLEESRMRIARFDKAIREESDRIRKRAENDYEVAVKAEASAKLAYQRAKSDADQLNNKAINFALARQEAESSRKLYDELLSRSKEAGIVEGLRSSKFKVVEPAMVPSSPARPKVPLYMGLALLLGLSLGTGSAILIDLADSRIADIKTLKNKFGKGPIGVLPWFSSRGRSTSGTAASPAAALNLTASADPASPYTEALRSFRTSLLLSRSTAAPQVIMFTSPLTQEGKTTTSANFAALLAQYGKRVLLVDTNLRHPAVGSLFKLQGTSGLTNLLESPATGALAVVEAIPAQPGLYVLSAGDKSSHPAETLGLSRFGELLAEYRQNFDFIILDSAPVMPFTDAVIVAGFADKVIVLSRIGQTKLHTLHASIEKLQDHVDSGSLELLVNGLQVRRERQWTVLQTLSGGVS